MYIWHKFQLDTWMFSTHIRLTKFGPGFWSRVPGVGPGFYTFPFLSTNRTLFNNFWATSVNRSKAKRGHRELITFPIDSNGDPPGLWQFIVHLTMNVGYYNMP